MSNLKTKLFIGLLVASGFFGSSVAATKPAARSDHSSASSVKLADPLAGDVWHAVLPSWPGTIQFDAKTKVVTLRPMGSDAMTATYVQAIKLEGSSYSGTVTMTLGGGQVSKANVVVDGKKLTMEFKDGQSKESYVKMTKAEEAAYLLKLPELLKAVPTAR